MKKILFAALFAASAALKAQDSALPYSAVPINVQGLSSVANVVDYDTSQSAAKILGPPCASSGPPTWRDLCAETLQALGATVSAATVASTDTFLGFDASDSGNLKLFTISDLGAASVADGSITLAKMADMVTDRLIGRQSGTGVPELISASGGLEWTTNAIQTSAFTGDVTKSAGGTAQTIAASAVTLAKMADLPTDTLIGRQSGTGAPEQISASGGLEWTTNAIQRSALTGDISASAGSNTTTISTTIINGFTTKTAPTPADFIAISDAAASNVNKKASVDKMLDVGPFVDRCWEPGTVNTAAATFMCGIIGSVAGGSAWALGTGEAGHPGVLTCNLATGATDRCSLLNLTNTSAILFGGGSMSAESFLVMKISALSSAAERYAMRAAGWNDTTTSGTDNVYFRYTDNVNSGKWELQCNSNTAGNANIDTGVTADTNWHSYRIVVNAAGDSAQGYIDGVAVGSPCINTPTVSIPISAGRETSQMAMSASKSVHTTTGPTFTVDAWGYSYYYATAR